MKWTGFAKTFVNFTNIQYIQKNQVIHCEQI